MLHTGTIAISILIITFVFSYKGFTNDAFFEGYKFDVDKILINKDYKRLITSGFLHTGWWHLIFNMLSLVIFSGSVESYLGGVQFLAIYLVSIVAGNLFTLLVHRQHSNYSSVGASGGVCGIIFASIALFPGMSVGLFLLPVALPGWLYGIVFVFSSIYGIKSGKGNTSHSSHLAGALAGMILALFMEPSAFRENYVAILVIAVPTMVFIYLVVTRPHILMTDSFFKAKPKVYDIDQKYNLEKNYRQKEVDRILEKIHKKGMNSLSRNEKQILKEFSGKI